MPSGRKPGSHNFQFILIGFLFRNFCILGMTQKPVTLLLPEAFYIAHSGPQQPRGWPQNEIANHVQT